MSNHYWNEYMNYYIQEDLFVNTLKYHQRTCRKESFITNISPFVLEISGATEVKASDVKLDKINVENDYINSMAGWLKDEYRKMEIKVTFPIFVFLNKKYVSIPGIYSYNFSNNEFLLIGELKDSICNMVRANIYEKEKDMIISFFINIVQALVLYEAKGYIKGIEEIGYLCGGLKNNFLEVDSIALPEQKFTHEVGINLKKGLLIDSIIT